MDKECCYIHLSRFYFDPPPQYVLGMGWPILLSNIKCVACHHSFWPRLSHFMTGPQLTYVIIHLADNTLRIISLSCNVTVLTF